MGKVHCDKHGIRPGTPQYQEALKRVALVTEREDFVEVGVVCPACALLYHMGQTSFKKLSDEFIDESIELRQRVAPGDVLVEWARTLSSCPRCGQFEEWATRQCCDIAIAVGCWESRLVAESLMEKESLAGPEKDDSSVGFYGKPTHRGTNF